MLANLFNKLKPIEVTYENPAVVVSHHDSKEEVFPNKTFTVQEEGTLLILGDTVDGGDDRAIIAYYPKNSWKSVKVV